MHEILADLVETASRGRAVAYTALVETRGSTPQKAGAVMLVFEDGSQAGTLGGGCVEAEVKRLVAQGGVQRDGKPFESPQVQLVPGDVLKIGKRRWLRVIAR